MRTFFIVVLLCTALEGTAEKLDVTFIVAADPHITMAAEASARDHVKALHFMTENGARMKWPAGLIGAGTEIPRPEAVFIAGDLSYDDKLKKGKSERQLFYDLYLDPKRTLLPEVVFPGAGNHDIAMHWTHYVAGAQDVWNFQVKELIEVPLSDPRVRYRFRPPDRPTWWNAPHYAVELGAEGKLLVVQLNTSIAEPCRAPVGVRSHGNYIEPDNPECDAYGWLEGTLKAHSEKHGASAPIILLQHYGYDDWGMTTDNYAYRGYWWAPEYRRALAAITARYNVIALIYGHSHRAKDPKDSVETTDPVFGGDVVTVTDPGQKTGRAFTNFKTGGIPEYCRAVTKPSPGIRCTSIAAEPTIDVSASLTDTGWENGRGWIDINNDGRADYCRAEGNWSTSIRCRLTDGLGFRNDDTPSHSVERGQPVANARWVMLARNKPAYCRISGYDIKCTPWDGGKFGADIVGTMPDYGWDPGRDYVDVNADGKLDHCRVVGSGPTHIACRVSSGDTFFHHEIMSGPIDAGFDEGRAWVDVNKDGRADFCRVLKHNEAAAQVGCILTKSDGTGFDTTEWVSPYNYGDGFDVGFHEGRTWADFTADGQADFCRVVQANSGDFGRIECTLAGQGAFGPSLRSLPINPGAESRTFVDVNGDSRADFCRVRDTVVACTLATTMTTKAPVPAIGVAWGGCAGGGFSVFRVTDHHLEVAEVRTKDPCTANYAGAVTAGCAYVIPRGAMAGAPECNR